MIIIIQAAEVLMKYMILINRFETVCACNGCVQCKMLNAFTYLIGLHWICKGVILFVYFYFVDS